MFLAETSNPSWPFIFKVVVTRSAYSLTRCPRLCERTHLNSLHCSVCPPLMRSNGKCTLSHNIFSVRLVRRKSLNSATIIITRWNRNSIPLALAFPSLLLLCLREERGKESLRKGKTLAPICKIDGILCLFLLAFLLWIY